MKKNLMRNQKGFSLIELMVVVAIMGVLAAIGVPQFAKFQAKARQAEAKGHLSALFTAETAFKSEWNYYTVDLTDVGFAVTGSLLRYIAGFNATACSGYSTAGGAPAQTAANSQTQVTAVNTEGATWHGTLAPGTTAVTMATTSCTATTFTAVAQGDPRNNVAAFAAATSDAWSINQSKLISNPITGL